MVQLDHLVIAVPNLVEGCAWFGELTGVEPIPGGRHLDFGTHNALVGLGNRCYVELIAVDPESTIPAPRWMAVDRVTKPMLTRWALATSAIEEKAHFLENYHPGLGEVRAGRRMLPSGEELVWQLSLPLPEPAVEPVPFLIDWSASKAHPADSLVTSCSIRSLSLKHPTPQRIQHVLRQLSVDVDVSYGSVPGITAKLETPRGVIDL